MPCTTTVQMVNLDNTAINREARRKLGLPETGKLSTYDASRVRVEAGIIKAQQELRRVVPKAIIKRTDNVINVSLDI